MQILLRELELSMPYREQALRYVEQTLPNARTEEILGVAEAKINPACVLKVRWLSIVSLCRTTRKSLW